jgi:glycosyltransferase involved in cell wall biosynthesis
MPGFLRDLDLFVLSSRQEGHPMALLEAMAMQCPVIATDIPGIAETITEGVDGRLVPAGDVPALAAAMARLLKERDRARRLGVQARRKVLATFTVDRMVRRTGVLYEELLAEKGLSA